MASFILLLFSLVLGFFEFHGVHGAIVLCIIDCDENNTPGGCSNDDIIGTGFDIFLCESLFFFLLFDRRFVVVSIVSVY